MTHYFAGNPLDRGEAERRDPALLDAMARSAETRFLPFWRLNVLVDRTARSGRPVCLGWLGPEVLDRLPWDAPAPVFLGIHGGISHFALDVSFFPDQSALRLPEGWGFEEARATASQLQRPETGIVAQAKAQIDWHHRHRFCGVCGGPTEPDRGGMQRRCTSCRAEHFPRTDPVVIALVSSGQRCLLGQSRLWGPRGKFYSCLSGFMDQGESIEEAVAREVREEAGLEVTDVRYHSSQPWPFPSSLMIGCHARALSEEIRFDQEEMNDVRWFDRDDIELAFAGRHPELTVPGEIAIAHHLIKAWANGESG